ERNHDQVVQSTFRQQPLLKGLWRNQLGSNIGAQNPQGMRIEGQSDRLGAGGAGSLYHLIQHLPVAAVHAVKIADADNGRTQVARDFFNGTENPHAISNSSFKPSCARRTWLGNDLLVSS